MKTGGKGEGYVTNHVTNEAEQVVSESELIERYGRHEETRTPDLPGEPGRSNQRLTWQ